MSQFLGQHLNQQMRLEQKLTPQLIQSMTILQKPVAELEAYVAEALESNAALEIAEPEAHEASQDGQEARHPKDESSKSEETGFARLDRLSRDYDPDGVDWQERRPAARRVSDDGERDAKLAAMANTEERSHGLQEHLLEQWGLLELSTSVRRAGEVIINSLDPDGYLRVRLDELAQQTNPPLAQDDTEAALGAVHKLDPPGVGARDVVECLLLQLDALPGDNAVERTLIKNHLHDLSHNRLPHIARETGFDMAEINESMKAMRQSLCLHPGYLVGDRSVPQIRPDVIVEYAETGGGLTVRLARGNMPKLRVSDEVASLARSKDHAKEEREFARRQVEEATALIDAVQFRRGRLLEVARSIVERQRDFFDVGPQGLKVCRMSDLAAELNCDPSTISRTVADKYMQTPRGILPLRYFFTGGTESADGESVGWDRVKTRVKELIDAEDRRHPLNDDEIVEKLAKEGIDLSRRTVAKYRAQLDIPAARQRKQF